MFKSPNDMYFESKQGQGKFLFRGFIKADHIEAPELDQLALRIERIRAQIEALSSGSPPSSTPATNIPTSTSTSTDDRSSGSDLLAQVREEIRAANLPNILSQMDEIRAILRSSPAPTAPVTPQVSVQQLSRLQDQVTRLVGQMNTLQDRVSILEGRVRLVDAAPADASSVLVESVTDVASAAASAAATAVVNRAALKLEDMVSPGALYNLRKVSDRGPIKYAW